MISDLLPGYVIAALEEAEEELRALQAKAQPLRALNSLSDHFRIAGIGELFIKGRSQPLRRRLHQSARAFAFGLSRLPELERLGSKMKPFFDAIAADDLDAATDIARLSRRTWAKGKEYEEDFLFVEVIMQRFFLDSKIDAAALLARWRTALADTEDMRLPVVRALIQEDAESFGSALSQYLAERARTLDDRTANRSVPGDRLATEWHFCVEGVAFAKLARRAGLEIASQYRHVPAVSLQPANEDWERSDWKVIGRTSDE